MHILWLNIASSANRVQGGITLLGNRCLLGCLAPAPAHLLMPCCRDFDIGSILRPTPIKAESGRRAGESQEAASQALPIHSLHTPDLAALQGSQGIATSLSAFQNDIQNHAWQHIDGASQQNGLAQDKIGQDGRVGPPIGQSQEGSGQDSAVQHPNGTATEHAAQVLRPFDQRYGLSQQHSQQGSQNWEASSGQTPSDTQNSSQPQVRVPKRKLPFSVAVQHDAKRQSPGPDTAAASEHGQQSVDAGTQPSQNGALILASPDRSLLAPSKAQLMSPSLLLVAQQASPSTDPQLAGHKHAAHTLASDHAMMEAQGNVSQWSPAVSAMLH